MKLKLMNSIVFLKTKTTKNILNILIPAVALGLIAMTAYRTDWGEVQKLKAGYLSLTAQHAMEQQKTSESSPVSIPLNEMMATEGEVYITESIKGSITLDIKASPRSYNTKTPERVKIGLSRPMDLFTGHSGLAVFVKCEEGTSPEVRAGIQIISPDGKKTEILPILPVLSAWGDVKHELYFDWSLLNFEKDEEAVAILKAVNEIDITFASVKRAPLRGSSDEARPAILTMSNLRLVDYLKGSYDPSRQSLKFDNTAGKWLPDDKYDLTIQHRCQEVTGIVAAFGKEAGLKSAMESLDMAARTQCWDGSFQDGRRGAVTVASGEYTFGFTIYGLLHGYLQLEKVKYPQLNEKITIGPFTMTRRDFYQRMFYRGALARSAATPSTYRDDIIGGNTLISGANRVLGYAIAMRMVADALTNPAWKKQVMEKYTPLMQEIADAQGKFSGGFPVLGEGDRYDGKGIHYDAGYTRTHMDWLVVGVMQTGDPLLVQMLKRYQTVFEAAMNEKGLGILPMISERHQGDSPVRLILPDATFQAGLKYKLPIIAQWGYNCSQAAWADTGNQRGNHFSTASRARGYTLGAHMSILQDDMNEQPVPKDIGYLFPRQFPLWSTQACSKDGQVLRTSVMIFNPDGTQVSDYRIDVGEYPVTVGVPVMVKSSAKVTAIAKKLSGWPKLLPEGAEIKISGGGATKGKVGIPLKVKIEKETIFIISGPEIMLPTEAGGEKIPFSAEFILTPEKAGQEVELTVLQGTIPYSYKVN